VAHRAPQIGRESLSKRLEIVSDRQDCRSECTEELAVEPVAHRSQKAGRKSRHTGLGVGFGTEPQVKGTFGLAGTVAVEDTVSLEGIVALERTVALVRTVALAGRVALEGTPSLLEQKVHRRRRHRGG
jgi:hypothetical protein